MELFCQSMENICYNFISVSSSTDYLFLRMKSRSMEIKKFEVIGVLNDPAIGSFK